VIVIHGFIDRDDSFSVANAVCQVTSTPTTRSRLGIMFNAFCIVHVHMQGKFYSGLSEKCEVLSLYALCRKLHIGHFHAIPLHCISYNIAVIWVCFWSRFEQNSLYSLLHGILAQAIRTIHLVAKTAIRFYCHTPHTVRMPHMHMVIGWWITSTQSGIGL